MKFKEFMNLNENGSRTSAKIGLYPSISDALGQYPPLYGMSAAADLITYIDMMYGIDNLPGKNGIIRYKDWHPHHKQKVKNKK
jgi:hypothetical protein